MLGWVTVFLLLILIEAIIGDFTALTISIGALAAIAAALMSLGFPGQVIVFSVTSLLSFFLFRSYLQKKFIPSEKHFTAHSFIGNQAEVIEKIETGKKGRVKIGGEIWFAEAANDIETGEKVIISEMDGALLRVIPEHHILPSVKPAEKGKKQSEQAQPEKEKEEN